MLRLKAKSIKQFLLWFAKANRHSASKGNKSFLASVFGNEVSFHSGPSRYVKLKGDLIHFIFKVKKRSAHCPRRFLFFSFLFFRSPFAEHMGAISQPWFPHLQARNSRSQGKHRKTGGSPSRGWPHNVFQRYLLMEGVFAKWTKREIVKEEGKEESRFESSPETAFHNTLWVQ